LKAFAIIRLCNHYPTVCAELLLKGVRRNEITSLINEANRGLATAHAAALDKKDGVLWLTDCTADGTSAPATPAVGTSDAAPQRTTVTAVPSVGVAASLPQESEARPATQLDASALLQRILPVLRDEQRRPALLQALMSLRLFVSSGGRGAGTPSGAALSADAAEHTLRQAAQVNGAVITAMSTVSDLLALRSGGAGDEVKHMAIIVAGYESAGKTLMLDGLLGSEYSRIGSRMRRRMGDTVELQVYWGGGVCVGGRVHLAARYRHHSSLHRAITA
jgi:hypothetical protein